MATDEYNKIAVNVHDTHHEPRGTCTGTRDRMTVSSVGTATSQHATLSIESRRTGLITVKPCPSRRAGAFTRKRVAATI